MLFFTDLDKNSRGKKISKKPEKKSQFPEVQGQNVTAWV